MDRTRLATRAVHAGPGLDPASGAHATPIVQTSTFGYRSFARGERLFAGEEEGYVYSRIGNPTVAAFERALADLEGAEAAVAFSSGALCVADTTFATPMLTRPLEHGADLVLHSATRYLGGHGDALGGVLAGPRETMDAVRMEGLRHLGGALGPLEAFVFLRGLKTLPLRMERQCANARRVAEALRDHPAVAEVHWHGFEDHPEHALARRQMDDFGGMVSLELTGGKPAAARFLDRLTLFTQAVSLGDVESLATHPASTTHQLLDETLRLEQGVTDALVRLSVGIEDADDLVEDVRAALGA